MKFRTEIGVPNLDFAIGHDTPIVLLGSCFTDEIGQRLRQQLFDVTVNPLGTLFNPISIADAIEETLDERMFAAEDLFEVDGTWRTLRRHSRFSLPDKGDTLQLLNSSLAATREKLLSAKLLIVTFGSAIAHFHMPTAVIAANCHKLSANQFSIEYMDEADIVSRWTLLIERLHGLNPGLEVIFTVSPVRHIGYGLQRDRLSKSTLIVAANRLAAASGMHYFPSYEIMVDDLRDYRWYADDMVHPSAPAVGYIYDIFRQATMTPATIIFADKWEKLTRRLQHRHTSPEAADAFRSATLADAEALAAGDTHLLRRFTAMLPQ